MALTCQKAECSHACHNKAEEDSLRVRSNPAGLSCKSGASERSIGSCIEKQWLISEQKSPCSSIWSNGLCGGWDQTTAATTASTCKQHQQTVYATTEESVVAPVCLLLPISVCYWSRQLVIGTMLPYLQKSIMFSTRLCFAWLMLSTHSVKALLDFPLLSSTMTGKIKLSFLLTQTLLSAPLLFITVQLLK